MLFGNCQRFEPGLENQGLSYRGNLRRRDSCVAFALE